MWRTAAWMSVAPMFSASSLPVRIKIVMALSVSWALLPAIPSTAVPALSINWLDLVLLTGRETLIGLLLGFCSRFILYSAQFAGQLVASEMGLQSGQALAPGSGESTNAPGVMLELLTLFILFSTEVHHQWIAAFSRTYQWLPLNQTFSFPAESIAAFFGGQVREFLLLGIQLSIPIIAGGFLINLVLMLLARALPQLPVFGESFAFRIIVGLFLLGSTLQIAAAHLSDRSGRSPAELLGLARLLSGRGGP